MSACAAELELNNTDDEEEDLANTPEDVIDSQDSTQPLECSSEQSQNVWGRLIPVSSEHANTTLNQVFEFRESTITIGRDDTNDVILKCPNVSNKHCKIVREQMSDTPECCDTIFFYDTSTNGTWIGKKRIHQSRELINDGCEIMLVPQSKKRQRKKLSFFFQLETKAKQAQLAAQNDPTGKSLESRYFVLKVLGRGAFSTVKLVQCRTSGDKYALKVIDRSTWKRMEQCTPRHVTLLDEVEIMRKADHENIVKVYEYFQSEDIINVILDFCDGGDMLEYIQEHGAYKADKARRLFKQMIDAVDYLHSLNIAHRDLKPDNILLTDKEGETLKISDFGISRQQSSSGCGTIIGTPLYQAPEVQLRRTQNGYDGTLADYWSLGIILYVMLVAAPPIDSTQHSSQIVHMAETHTLPWYDEHVSETAKDLIYRLLTTEPSERITAAGIYQHAWMQGFDTFAEHKQAPCNNNNNTSNTNNNQPQSSIEVKEIEDAIDAYSTAEVPTPTPCLSSSVEKSVGENRDHDDHEIKSHDLDESEGGDREMHTPTRNDCSVSTVTEISASCSHTNTGSSTSTVSCTRDRKRRGNFDGDDDDAEIQKPPAKKQKSDPNAMTDANSKNEKGCLSNSNSNTAMLFETFFVHGCKLIYPTKETYVIYLILIIKTHLDAYNTILFVCSYYPYFNFLLNKRISDLFCSGFMKFVFFNLKLTNQRVKNVGCCQCFFRRLHMFQYRVQENLYRDEQLQIFNGMIKATKEEVEITAIKRDCYRNDANKLALEKYLKSLRSILTTIDVFPSKVFPTQNHGEWLVIIESKQHYNLRDFIVNNLEIEQSIRDNIDVLSLIYELISVALTFTDYDDGDDELNYERLIPQNIFISEYNEIFLKFPHWLLLDRRPQEDCTSYRYYVPPHILLTHFTHNIKEIELDPKIYNQANQACNIDIWSLGCCVAEIFYGLPLFGSVDVCDQLLTMFQILGVPDFKRDLPWKYCKLSETLMAYVRSQPDTNTGTRDTLPNIIDNAAIVDLLRCCLQYTAKQQITFHQLSIFVDMFEINNRTENQQHCLRFSDIHQQQRSPAPSPPSFDHSDDVILIGSATFIEEWQLLSSLQANDGAQSPPPPLPQEQQQPQQQRGCQTIKVQTNDSSTNTEAATAPIPVANIAIVDNKNDTDKQAKAEKPESERERTLQISDCVDNLPFRERPPNEEKPDQYTLLIIEFSNICNIQHLNIKKYKSFSFECISTLDQVSSSSPIFNINDLTQTGKDSQKVYIHVMLNDDQYQYITNGNKAGVDKNESLECLHVQFVAYKNGNTVQSVLGEINIDIALLREYKIIQGYYHIFPTDQDQSDDIEKAAKLAQVYVRVLPQFNIGDQDCNASTITDDQSIISNQAW
eukprot:CAMPEP_0202692960 /NCGR_PEP_ID=MMETSP1385-20130828/7201_1 /ASSEMBLY_ACC=CAM_ASM_000861 /TAXON_ID=933848 /ORGANISM="Elphidium margaritaceum" /LENGTH=1378 /DNA_ID=CAMNT_0049348571 /DNA_START=26 /DNA_END=4160 /DNA_ORIENTATION=+